MERLSVELTWKDWTLAALLGAAVFAFLHVCGFVGLHPSVWVDASVATGVIPPHDPIPGVWCWLVAPLYLALDVSVANRALVWMGHLSGFILAMSGYLVLYGLLPSVVRLRMRRVAWGRHLGRGVLALGTVFFLCADPVWRSLQTFSPTTLALVLTMCALGLALHFLHTGRLWFAYAAMLAFGVLSADSPAGFVFAAGFAAVAGYRSFQNEDSTTKTLVNALENPVVRVVALRRMAVCLFVGLSLAVTANVVWFVCRDGLEANALRGVDLVVRYFECYWRQITGAATALGWAFGVTACLVPLVFALWALRRATDDEAFLSYRFGLVFLAVGLVSFLQVAGWPRFWFWCWIPSAARVQNEYLLCVCGFLSALTSTWALCVAAVEIFFRNYRRIAERLFPDAAPNAGGVAPATEPALVAPTVNRRRRAVVWTLLVLALLASTVPYRWKATERRMAAAIFAYLDEVVSECGDGVHTLFTDGTLDRGIELRARAAGQSFFAVSLMSGSTEYDRTLRLRGVTDDEDRAMLESGAADALRTWVNDKTNRLDGIAVQMGIELWKCAGRELPRCSGVTAFPSGLDDAAAAAGQKAAHALAEQILEVYATGRPDASTDHRLLELFRSMQWNVARFFRLRADAFNATKNVDASVEESLLGYELDRQNSLYQNLRRRTDWVAQQQGARLTPREGLKVGLARADFALARTFAESILRANPDDPQANFAVGMAYFTEEQYARAEVYLTRVAAQLPNDIAVLNNLAVVQFRQGRFDDAQATCDRARTVASSIRNPQIRDKVLVDLKKITDSIAKKRAAAQKP